MREKAREMRTTHRTREWQANEERDDTRDDHYEWTLISKSWNEFYDCCYWNVSSCKLEAYSVFRRDTRSSREKYLCAQSESDEH